MTMNGARVGLVYFMLLVFTMLQGCSTQAKWKGSVVKEGDITVIKNPKEPIYKTPILELKEDLSLGGPDAKGDLFFSMITAVVIDDAGAIYVLDYRSSNIKVFDSSGALLQTIGRRGQGPGELEMPLDLSFVRTTGELAVHQMTRRMSFFKTDGTFLRHLLYKDVRAGRGLCDSRGNIFITEVRREDKESRYVIKKLSADGTIMATFADSPAPSGDKFNPFMPFGSFQIDTGDNLIYGYPESYEIQFFGASDAKLFKKIVREYEPVAVKAEERAEQEKSAQGRGIVFDFSKFHPAYRRFFLSDLGHLFVETFEKAKDGKIIHDIFDPEGRFIGRVPLKGLSFGVFKDKYYAREDDEDGYQYLKRYALTWLVK